MGYVNTVHIIYVSDAPIRDFGNYPISHYLIQLLTDTDSQFDVSNTLDFCMLHAIFQT